MNNWARLANGVDDEAASIIQKRIKDLGIGDGHRERALQFAGNGHVQEGGHRTREKSNVIWSFWRWRQTADELRKSRNRDWVLWEASKSTAK